MTDPAIRQPMSFRSEYKFFLKDIPVEITVRLYKPIHSSDVVVRQSHTISIAGLDAQDKASCENMSEDGEVLQSVVSEFVCNYNAAVDKGLKPEAGWLKPNPDFR